MPAVAAPEIFLPRRRLIDRLARPFRRPCCGNCSRGRPCCSRGSTRLPRPARLDRFTHSPAGLLLPRRELLRSRTMLAGGYPSALEWPSGRAWPQFGLPALGTRSMSFCLPCCEESSSSGEDCACCDPGTMPNAFDVTIAGVLDDICATCTDWNQTWHLTYEGNCIWAVDDGTCGAAPRVELAITCLLPDEHGLSYDLLYYNDSGNQDSFGAMNFLTSVGDTDCSQSRTLTATVTGTDYHCDQNTTPGTAGVVAA
jgi:hypothetical protein